MGKTEGEEEDMVNGCGEGRKEKKKKRKRKRKERKRGEKKVFFFKQKTAYEIKECDWSSDVCSSDLSSGTFRIGFLSCHKPG